MRVYIAYAAFNDTATYQTLIKAGSYLEMTKAFYDWLDSEHSLKMDDAYFVKFEIA